LYPHPNAAALTLERAAAAALLLALSTRDRDRWFWTIAGACIASATALTFSRGAWAALAISGILAAFLSGRRRLGVGVAGSALLAFLAAFLLFPERFRTDLTSGSDGLRLAVWRSTLTMLGDRPLTGVGLDQYLYQYLPRYVEPSAWPERFTSHPHNVFLDAWVRLGMGGLLLVCIAVWTVVRSLRRQTSPLTAAVGLGLFTGLLHGLVDRAYFTPELAFSFWLAAVILDLPRTAPSAANDGGRDQCAFW
jgi:O-antigen ligase